MASPTKDSQHCVLRFFHFGTRTTCPG